MSTFEIGEVVATRRFSDGAEIIGRIEGGSAGLWAVVDARNLIWRRTTEEIWRPRRGPTPAYAEPLIPSPPKKELTLVQRVLEALDEGRGTSRSIADRLGADMLRVSGTLSALGNRGLAVRVDERTSDRGQKIAVWARASAIGRARDGGAR